MKRMKKATALTTAALLTVPAIVQAAPNEQAEGGTAAVKEIKQSSQERQTNKYMQQQEQEQRLSTDTLIIKYSKPLAKPVHQRAGVKILRSYPALGYDVVQVKSEDRLKETAAYYKKQKAVTAITPSVKYKTLASPDPKSESMYHLQQLEIEKAMKLAGKHDVTVAVIDTGVDVNHSELKGQLLPPYNVVRPANGAKADLHGTHVAGIIGSKSDNGIGGKGINPKAKLLPIDVFNGSMFTNDYLIAEGIRHAIQKNADVINMSIGSSMSSPILQEAIDEALEAGITLVAAAGNEATDAYSYPGAYSGVISVGSTNEKKALSSYSNYGPSVDVVAPGENVYNSAFNTRKGSTFMKLSGTSMASPVVAAVASLIKTKHPDLTGYEIEAILESTATDLGAKGYDAKFANGLINPEAALKYDIKKLPKREEYAANEQLEKAKTLKPAPKAEVKGSLTKPEQKQWYKVDLKEGQFLQTVLSGSELYDYGMELYFYPGGEASEDVEPVKINRTQAGADEAYLYEAVEDGALVIAVEDMNGNYNVSGQSPFTLKTEIFTNLTEDEATAEQPVAIDKLPYKTKEHRLFASGEMPDSDFFTFTVDAPQVVSLSVSGLPGVDSAMSIYMEEPAIIVEDEEELPADVPAETEEPAEDPSAEMPEEEMGPAFVRNKNGAGEGEKLSFQAVPGLTYKVEVTNNNLAGFDFGMDLSFLFGMTPAMDELYATSSAYPYELKAEIANLPEDEDGLPMYDIPDFPVGDGMAPPVTPQDYQEQLQSRKDIWQDLLTGLLSGQKEATASEVMDKALTITEGENVEGYLQMMGDIDYYKFKPQNNAIFEVSLNGNGDASPMGTVFEYDEELQELIPLADVGASFSLFSLLGGGAAGEAKAAIALKANKTYVISTTDEMGNVAADPYSLKVKKLTDAPKEDDKDQNEMLRAKVLKPGMKHTNYLAYADDIDYYYFKNYGKEQVYGLMVEPQAFGKEVSQLPADLQTPLMLTGMVIEDTNGNMRIDDKEAMKSVTFGPDFMDIIKMALLNEDLPSANTSIKAKEKTGYFVVANNMMAGTPTLQPYQVQLVDLNKKDEDQMTQLSSGTPKKPIAMKKQGTEWVGKAYMNAGASFGDADFFDLNVAKEQAMRLSVDMESGLDGKLTVMDAKGKVIVSVDRYGENDTEVISSLKLKKGKYFIKVTERDNKASTKEYTVKVK
ncbi:subtilisin family serine protease [Bacillus ectoiniformans]|uniref:S8 family peptidase n=1 Tax=Bacillus ectoiniformans TaxID=1494429 RepID=UPI0019564887|nr:S8 family serine peptidase [Bacillus ectoiniformans]MBM7648406.1 subtilisin family serine protease [Bacillus ectoiniformans]